MTREGIPLSPATAQSVGLNGLVDPTYETNLPLTDHLLDSMAGLTAWRGTRARRNAVLHKQSFPGARTRIFYGFIDCTLQGPGQVTFQ